MIETITEQLASYCDCLKEIELNDLCKFHRNVNQLINLISIITNWKRGSDPCETFLMSERRELFDMQEISQCGCCDNYLVTLPLSYKQVEESSITVSFQVREGIKFSTITMTEDEYSYDPLENKIYLDFSNYNEVVGCGCEVITKIIVTYDAGYSSIPECLLPLFCDYLNYVIDMNKCQCGCSVCDAEYEDNIENAENSLAQESTYLIVREHILKAYIRQLESIALDTKSYSSWGKVI